MKYCHYFNRRKPVSTCVKQLFPQNDFFPFVCYVYGDEYLLDITFDMIFLLCLHDVLTERI